MQDQIRFISNQKKIQILKRFVDEEYVGADQSMKDKMKTEIEASKRSKTLDILDKDIEKFLLSEKTVREILRHEDRNLFIVCNKNRYTISRHNVVDTVIEDGRFKHTVIGGLFVQRDIFMEESLKAPRPGRLKYLIETHDVYPIKICLNSEKGLDYFCSKKQ